MVEDSVEEVDILVLGGGTGGTAAAWQAARLGASVLVAEPTPWLGGMITAAGVSAFDGNKGAMASGFFRRLRDTLEQHYGGREAVRTGWVSDTCFEPHVGARLLAGWVRESGARVWHGARLVAVHREGERVTGASIHFEGKLRRVRAKVTIDATEYGDGLVMAGIPYRLGRESRDELGEPHAPERPDMEVQDMTMVAILKRVPGGAPPVPAPPGYDPSTFECSTGEICPTPDEALLNHPLHSWESFLGYGLLPRDKFMLNWPFRANDSPDTIGIFGTPEERAADIGLAKHRTLAYVHYIQNELGHPEWGLATDEYDTPDRLPYMPYVRESRRLVPERTMVEEDVLPRPGEARAPFRADSIAIGDYFLDHHHSKAHRPPDLRLDERYPDNAPFQIPYGVAVPAGVEGFMAADKNIGVSHIVNGCTRLQPVVMLTGQAIGAAAALAVRDGVEPRAVKIPEMQRYLIEEEGVALYPFRDVDHTHPAFKAIQRLAMLGLNDRPDSMDFEPDAPIERAAAKEIKARWIEATGAPHEEDFCHYREGITRGEFCRALHARMGSSVGG